MIALLLALALDDRVRGDVIDPHQRPMPGAAIEIVCADLAQSGETNDSGRFEIDVRAIGSCEMRVSHPGFETVTRPIVLPSAGPLTVQLSPAAWEERVEVRAPRHTPADAATMTLGGATVAADAMRVAGPDSARWLALAERAAGMPLGARALTVNGMPASRLPSAEAIVSIAAAVDPFSVEVTGADRVTIDVTSEPPRRWQFDISPGLFTNRQHDVLLADAVQSDQHRAFGAGGPLTKSGQLRAQVSASTTRSQSRPAYVEQTISGDHLASSIESLTEGRAWSGEIYGRRGAWELDGALSHARSEMTNGGIGGRSGPPGMLGIESSADRQQLTWRRTGRIIFRGGLAFEREQSDVSSASSGTGFVFADRLLAGAPDTIAMTNHTSATTVRAIAASKDAPLRGWLIGVEAGSIALRERRLFNPSGIVVMTAPAEFSGARITRPGEVAAGVSTQQLAAFGQRVVVATNRIWARIGARVEWQRDFGLVVSPRVALGVRAGRFLVGGNFGTFSDLWAAADQLERDVRVAAPAIIESGTARLPVFLTAGNARRTDVVARSSITRPFPGGSIGVEELFRLGTHLSGLTRRAEADRLIDMMDAERSLTRRQTRIRLDLGRRGWMASGFYEHAYGKDDTDGPFSLPAGGGERGPSVGVPSHAFTGTLSARLGGVRVLMSGRISSGTAYSLLTGADPQGLFTFNGRVGGDRNRQRTPSSSDVSTYLAHQFQLPVARLGLDCGVRIENILGAVTPLDVERSAASTLAGRPVRAARGRSVSVWTTIGRR